jgi:uncharacterized protein YdhG (YjbR/CyaY superfamily)
MSGAEVDQYIRALDEPKRSTLEELRRSIIEVVPKAEEGISYGCPAFRVGGKVVAGFAAFKNHLSYLPHSGSVFPELADDLSEYVTSSGALRFSIDTPLPKSLVAKLIVVRLAQAFPSPLGEFLAGRRRSSSPVVQHQVPVLTLPIPCSRPSLGGAQNR